MFFLYLITCVIFLCHQKHYSQSQRSLCNDYVEKDNNVDGVFEGENDDTPSVKSNANGDRFSQILINRLAHLSMMVNFSSTFHKNFDCHWEEHEGKVSIEISEGRAFPPDFVYLLSSHCLNFTHCESVCDIFSCNYVARSKYDGLSHFYFISDANRNSKYMVPSTAYNSYRKICSSFSGHNFAMNLFVTEQGAKGRENCQWKKFDGNVPIEISEGRAFKPDFNYHFSMQCPNFNDCQRMCDQTSCNYIVRSKFDSLSHMYELSADKLQNTRLDSSTGYDSFKKECFDEPLMDCRWKKSIGKVLREISEGRAFKPDFSYQTSMQCETFAECQKLCDAMLCNYIVRSKFDGLSHMYEISEEKLTSKRMDLTKGYDSYTRECSNTSSSSPPKKRTNEITASDPNCKWTKMQRMVLTEISEGRAGMPDFSYHGSMCNYVVRSVFNGLSHMYTVVQNKLHSEYVDKSTGYDSFIKDCASGYQVQPNATNCTDCNQQHGNSGYNSNPYNSYYPPKENDFEKNANLIDQLNRERNDDEDAFFGPNKFSNFSHGSFVQTFTGLKVDDENQTMTSDADAEDFTGSNCTKFNWVELGVIPPVRDQGTCGSCYAFTSVDLAAAQYSIDRSLWNHAFLLSPQFVVDCLKPPGAFGCDGGRPVNVFQMASEKALVVPTEECYPYRNKVGQCIKPTCKIDPDEEEVTVKWARLLKLTGEKEKQRVAALLRWGPLITFIDASLAWQFYNGTGIIRSRHCKRVSNHAVLLVGYNYEGRVPYYIIKNSWGQDYGEAGYVKLEAGVNACNVASNLVVACTSNCEKLKKVKNLIQRPHSTGCLEVTTTSSFNSSLLSF